MKDLKEILLENLSEWQILYRVHATQRMFERGISEEYIFSVLKKGKIIEQYEEDFPFPSFLLNGFSVNNNPLHLVIGVDSIQKNLYIITVYEPDKNRWQKKFTRRLP